MSWNGFVFDLQRFGEYMTSGSIQIGPSGPGDNNYTASVQVASDSSGTKASTIEYVNNRITVTVDNGTYTISWTAENARFKIDGESYYARTAETPPTTVHRGSNKNGEVVRTFEGKSFTVVIQDGTDNLAKSSAAVPIITTDHQQGTTLFQADGNTTTNDAAADAILEVDTENNKKTLSVKKAITEGVDTTGDTYSVTVADTGTDTVYTLAAGLTVTAKNASFTTTNGTVSDVTGTLTLKSGSVTTSDADVNFDISAAGNDATVTFATGTAANGAVIKTAAGSITLSETGTATATVVNQDGSLSGLDGTVTVTGVPEGKSVTTTGAGTVSVNGIEFTSTDTDGVTVTPDGVTATTLTIGDLATGHTVTVGTAGKNYNVASTLYKSVSQGVTLTGTAAILGKDQSVTVDGHDTVINNGTVTLEVPSTGVIQLKPGMEFKMGNTTYAVAGEVSEGYVGTTDNPEKRTGYIVKVNDGTSIKRYILSEADMTQGVSVTDVFGQEGELWSTPALEELLPTIAIETVKYSETTYFLADGNKTTADNAGKAATLQVEGSRRTLTVESEVTGGVVTTGDTVAVVDKGTDTIYTLSQGQTVTANKASFTADSGVVSSVNGTLTVTSGSLVTTTGNAQYNLANSGSVAFRQGNSVDTSVTTTTGTITLKENNNKNDTTIKSDGTITGLDGDAEIEIRGALKDKTITTTGSGTLTLNGVSWTVDKDSDGVTFTVDTTTKSKISNVEGLDADATLSTTANVSGLTLNGCTLESAREGVKYTAGNPGVFDFSYAGASITVKGYTYKLKELSDRISIDTQGTITGLTPGEKVIVTNNTDGATFTYEVSGETLLINKTDGTGTTIVTNRLAEGELDGFIILQGGREAVNRATDSSVMQTEVGLEVSSQGVDSVTSGMLLDRNGQATNAENKAVATVTINSDDTLKYQAKEDKAQEVKVLAKSKKTWDITASGKNDTIEYAGSGEAVITAGAGNDKISITGTGAVEVNGVSGRNTIIHTGSGDATLKGGTGKDTLQSYNANDVLTGGEGEDIFILAGVESHVTDFAYGTDKAVVTSATGALDVSKIKANSEGSISYTGNGSTGGALNVEEQNYGDFYAVNLTDAAGNNKVNVAWTGENGGLINASSLTDKLLLLGNSNGSSDTLIGGQSKDTIVAGKGDSSLWGGAGSDLIESNGDSSNTIFFLAGDGSDTVKGFTPYGDSTSGNADTLNFGGQGVTGVKNTAEGIQIYHGNDKLTLAGNYTANTMIQWESGASKGVIKVGKQGEKNNFTYQEEVTNYMGGTGVDTLSVGAGDGDVSIWLNGSQGTYYDSVEIIDASKATGIATLAGDSRSNSIVGGKGANLLWGGTGSSADVLYAGSGYNVFYYGKNEGNDIIINTKADDEVMLYNMTLSDLRGAGLGTNQITLIQQNGQKLTISGKAHEFTFADGSTWSADYKSKTWSRVK